MASEMSVADENYRALTRFMSEVRDWLNPGGRLLLFFGTSGDMTDLRHLIDRSGLRAHTIGTRDLVKDGITVTYCTFRLTL